MSLKVKIGLILLVISLGCSKELMISNPKRPEMVPGQLEVHGDELQFNIKANVPGGSLYQGAVYNLVPKFTFEEQQINLDPITFNGSSKDQALNQQYVIPFNPDMVDGKLELTGDFRDTKTGELAAYRLPLLSSQGAITTSRLMKEKYAPAYSNVEPYYYERDTLRLDFEFALGGDQLSESAQNKQLQAQLDSIILSDRIILGSRVIGTHSPVGSNEVNRRLSASRAEAVRQLYEQRIVNHQSTALDRTDLQINVEFNSWDIFIEKLSQSRFWKRDSARIKEITANETNYEVIKTKLLNLPDINQISREVFPKLQMSRLQVVYGRTISDDEKLAEMVGLILKGEFDGSLNDALSVARQVPEGRTRIQIYQALQATETSRLLYNDWAATYLDSYHQWNSDRGTGHLNVVYELLLPALASGVSNEVLINLGIANAIAARYDLANRYFDQVSSHDVAPHTYTISRAMCALKSGDYNAAVRYYGLSRLEDPDHLFDHGLSLLLAGDYNGSLEVFNTALEKGADQPTTLYAQAVAAHRSANRNLTSRYLSELFAINPRYNDYFHEDHEFKDINKVLFPRYPDSLKVPVRGFKRINHFPLPVLAYPLPEASFKRELKASEQHTTYGDVAEQLLKKLGDLGWAKNDLTLFRLPGNQGLAVLARLEQTDDFGQSLYGKERWEPAVRFPQAEQPDDFLDNYHYSLRGAETGYFRLAVYVIGPADTDPIDPILIEEGSHDLSGSIVQRPSQNGQATLHVYEFRKPLSGKTELVTNTSINHLREIGLDWELNE